MDLISARDFSRVKISSNPQEEKMYKLALALAVLATLAQAPANGQILMKRVQGRIVKYRIPNGCEFYATRYGFSADDRGTCADHRTSDIRAINRLLVLRTSATPWTYCSVREAFADAVDLINWAAADPEYHLKLLKTDMAELDNIAFVKAAAFGRLIINRFISGEYEDANCWIFDYPDLYKRRTDSSSAATPFGLVCFDLDEIHRFFKSTGRLLPPGVPTVAERKEAEERFESKRTR